jgi:hypothetical protein
LFSGSEIAIRRPENQKYCRGACKQAFNEQGGLLTSALLAVVEALRLNPDRYAIIYNNRYDNNDNVLNNNTSTAAAVTYSSSSPYPKLYQNHYYNEYNQ